MLELKLAVRRGAFQLNVECSFSAQWTILFGPSGAGKSTLLRLIAGLENPDSGLVQADGRILTDTASRIQKRPGSNNSQRSIGMVTQRSALFPHMTVDRNISYGIPHVDLQECRRRTAEMLDLVGASQLASRRPRDLSGGEAQRVSLARALAPHPRLLLLDEPLSALDAAARDKILTRLQDWLAARNIQTLLVTHDAADALATEAEVALMEEGKITALGPAHLVLAKERARLLQRLLSPTSKSE